MTQNTVRALKAHLALNVRDVEASVAFYRRLFAIEPSKVRTGYAKFDVENPPLNFTLNQVHFGERGALSHLGIQVRSTEDVLAVRDRWAREGITSRDEMDTNCCYAIQDKAWVKDPDGNEWEVFVVKEDNLPTSPECACGIDDAVDASASEPVPATAVSCCPPQAPVSLRR